MIIINMLQHEKVNTSYRDERSILLTVSVVSKA